MLVIGEALVDILQDDTGHVTTHIGGSPLNVAVGVARLGEDVTLATRLGDDDAGVRICEALDREGVGLLRPSTNSPTSVARGTVDEDGQTTYLFESLIWDLGASSTEVCALAEESDVVHTGSLATSLDPGRIVALNAMRAARGHALVTYDPNIRPDIAGTRELETARTEEAVELADVVRASDRDLEWLYPERTAQQTVLSWLGLGPQMVVVTSGGRDAMVVTKNHTVIRSARHAEVVDTVGAGDATMSGIIGALTHFGCIGVNAAQRVEELTEDQVDRVLQVALASGTLCVEAVGAEPPTRDQLLREAGPYEPTVAEPPQAPADFLDTGRTLQTQLRDPNHEPPATMPSMSLPAHRAPVVPVEDLRS